MNSKNKVVNYYQLEESKSVAKNKTKKGTVISKINEKIKTTYDLLKNGQSKKIKTIPLKDDEYYICAMDKGYSKDPAGQDFAWLISISKLDKSRQVEIGNMNTPEVDKRNHTLQTKKSEGLVVETQFLYDPETHVFASFRTAGGVSFSLLKSFLVNFCNVKGINFAIIPDQDGLNDINNMTKGNSITYKIAGVDAIQSVKNPNLSELADIKYANDIGGKELQITISAGNNSLDLKKFKDKLIFLFKNIVNLNIKKLQAQGKNINGVEEPIDLIEHRLKSKGNLKYNNIITTKNAFDFLDNEYGKVYPFVEEKIVKGKI